MSSFGLPLPWLGNPRFAPPPKRMAPVPPPPPPPRPIALAPDPIPLYRTIEVLKPFELHSIAEQVRIKHNLTPLDWKSRRRFEHLVFARQEYFWRAINETDRSTPAIGRAIGGYDHSTVIKGAEAHEYRMAGRKRPRRKGPSHEIPPLV